MKLSGWLCFILVLFFFQCTVQAHSVDDRQLLRVEPLTSVRLHLAPRADTFYTKRGLTPNPVYTPTARAVDHDDTLKLVVQAHNQTYHLHLLPNLELFHPNAVMVHGDRVEPLHHHQWRIYKGHVVDPAFADEHWRETLAGVDQDDQGAGVLGWARIVLRPDLIQNDMDYPVFEGSFQVHHDLFHVKTVQNYRLSKRADDAELKSDETTHMVVYRDSDTTVRKQDETRSGKCGMDNLLFNQVPAQTPFPRANDEWGMFSLHGAFESRSQLDTHARGLAKRAPVGCPSSKKINYMGVAADCSYTKHYRSSENARTQIITDWNSASALYERTFNIALGLINITVMGETCPPSADSSMAWNVGCSDDYSIGDRLNDFSRWRGTMSDDGAGLWHLMTSCSTGVEVGIAWLKQLCNSEVTTQTQGGSTQHVSGTGVSSIIRDEWKVVAHEIGHGFGAIHDCTTKDCPCSGSCQCCPLSTSQCDAGGTYIMNPSSNVSSNDFSPCSISTICGLFPTLGTCLEEPGSRTVETLKMCGNGIKEEGEDCDTGGQPSNCCDPKTCKFKNGAVCDDFNDLCCQQCQLKPKNATCRPAASSCDYAEYCSGDSADCPPDKFLDDTTSCGDGLQCASGACTSRDAQCKARGSVVNVTRACPSSSSCQLVCDSPKGSGCMIFTGHFLDGTSCGLGGTCKDGSCNLGGIADRARDWLADNKQIAIPVGVILAILLLLCIGRCLWAGCFGYRGCRKRNTAPPPAPHAYRPDFQPQYAPPPPPPPQAQPPPYNYAAQDTWVDPRAYNGNYPPPPPHSPAPVDQGFHRQAPSNPPRSPTSSPAFLNRPHHEGVI